MSIVYCSKLSEAQQMTAISATNQILGRTAGIQHHAWKIKNHQNPKPLSFKEWMQGGIKYYQSKGFSFEIVTPSLMRIKRPGFPSLLRTARNFRDEYENEYLTKF